MTSKMNSNLYHFKKKNYHVDYKLLLLLLHCKLHFLRKFRVTKKESSICPSMDLVAKRSFIKYGEPDICNVDQSNARSEQCLTVECKE